jgi:hypothetical protein
MLQIIMIKPLIIEDVYQLIKQYMIILAIKNIEKCLAKHYADYYILQHDNIMITLQEIEILSLLDYRCVYTDCPNKNTYRMYYKQSYKQSYKQYDRVVYERKIRASICYEHFQKMISLN